jgi:hypothetical protein
MAIEFVPSDETLEGLTRAEVMALVVDETTIEMAYDEMLDEVYGTATVAGYEFETSAALRELDPIAYRCGYADYVSEHYVEIDPADFMESPCVECGEQEADEHGMCPSCLHNAYRSGWQPGSEQ